MAITGGERIRAALEHRTLDRIPICDDGFWAETIARWEAEGLPRGTHPADYFGLDRIARVNGFDTSFFPHEIYEDTDDHCVDLNGQGTVVKWYKNRGTSSGHMELDHRVKTIEDWRGVRDRLTVSPDRFRPDAAHDPGDFVVAGGMDHFWMSFVMCGMENLCCWLVQAPDQMREIYDDWIDFLIGMLDLGVERNADFDALWFFTDMAFNTGPMFSPATYRDVIAPGYARLRRWCTDHGKWMLLHCDGNVNELMPELVAGGFDWVHPLEARAGNDVRQYKELYGDRITLVGNINADVYARGDRAEIEDEIASKISVAKKDGGYVYCIDHSVPPTIAFDAYAHAIEMVKRYGSY